MGPIREYKNQDATNLPAYAEWYFTTNANGDRTLHESIRYEAMCQCCRRVEWGGAVIPEAEMCNFVGPNPKAMWVEYELRRLGLIER